MTRGDIVGTCGLLAGLALLAGAATPPAIVKSETVPVHSKMDETSDVVIALKKGDAVVIEMSIMGKGNVEWCSVQEPTRNQRLGYVRCEFLARPPAPKSAAAPVPAVSAQPPKQAAGRQAESDDFWSVLRRDSRFGVPGHPVTLGETRYLGEAGVFALTFGFSLEQKHRVLQIAIESGIPACIEDTDKYVRQGRMPPDVRSGGPITKCDWIFQTFYERTFALITPEQQAAHRTSYAEFRRQVAGRRHNLSERSRELK